MALRAIVWEYEDVSKTYLNRTFSTGYQVLTAKENVLYIGFDRRFIGLFMNLPLGGVYTVAGDINLQYWDGQQFVNSGVNYSLDATKFVTWNLRSDMPGWERYSFTDADPHVAVPPDSQDRFWIKISVTSVVSAATVTSITVSPYTQYTTVDAVSDFLQYTGFDDESTPTEATVEDIIARHESELDKLTRRSWRVRETVEYQEFNYAGIKCIHSPIRQLRKVQIWQGTNWRNLALGRTGEAYPNESLGMVYFTRFFVPIFVPYSGGGAVMPFVYLYMMRYPVELTYIYGEDFESAEDAGMVEQCVILMASLTLLQQYERSILTKAGVDRVEMSTRLRMWREQIDDITRSLSREITIW